MMRAEHALTPRKVPSLQHWNQDSHSRSMVLKKAEANTAILIQKADTISLNSEASTNGSITFELSFKGRKVGLGSAVPISEDGYFLTAAHCADEPPLDIIALGANQMMERHPARVVWRGDLLKPGIDLAVIHVPIRPKVPFSFADPTDVSRSSVVGMTGWSGFGTATKPTSTAAGRIRSVSELHRHPSGAAWRVIHHDAPLNAGDSGGPLFSNDGNVLGINTTIHFDNMGFLRATIRMTNPVEQPLSGYHGIAIWPETNWLNQLLDADRLQHPHSPRE